MLRQRITETLLTEGHDLRVAEYFAREAVLPKSAAERIKSSLPWGQAGSVPAGPIRSRTFITLPTRANGHPLRTYTYHGCRKVARKCTNEKRPRYSRIVGAGASGSDERKGRKGSTFPLYGRAKKGIRSKGFTGKGPGI